MIIGTIIDFIQHTVNGKKCDFLRMNNQLFTAIVDFKSGEIEIHSTNPLLVKFDKNGRCTGGRHYLGFYSDAEIDDGTNCKIEIVFREPFEITIMLINELFIKYYTIRIDEINVTNKRMHQFENISHKRLQSDLQ